MLIIVVRSGRDKTQVRPMKTMPAVLLAVFCTAAIVAAIIADAAIYEERWVYKSWVTLAVVVFLVLIKRRTRK
jgi:hypothetical protein